ncbi:MAG: hypothetical protein PHF97_12545 [Bacteroidales bacterium]|nr:hypothetical protein [Bacteroidales bacterium]
MNKLYLIFLISWFLSSCSTKHEKEKINHFILFGTSGFYLIDTTKWIFDSTKFDIRTYFEFSKDSSIKVARRFYKKNIEYLSANPKDTIGLSSLLDTLVKLKLSDTTFYDTSKLSMYDGFYYTIYYETSKNRVIKIKYIPERLPQTLRNIHCLIVSKVYSKDFHYYKKFTLNNLIRREALKEFKIWPPPPKPGKVVEKVIFPKMNIDKKKK